MAIHIFFFRFPCIRALIQNIRHYLFASHTHTAHTQEESARTVVTMTQDKGFVIYIFRWASGNIGHTSYKLCANHNGKSSSEDGGEWRRKCKYISPEKRRTKWVPLLFFSFAFRSAVIWSDRRAFNDSMCVCVQLCGKRHFTNSSIFIKASGYQKVVREFLKSLPARGFSSSSSSVSFTANTACLFAYEVRIARRHRLHGAQRDCQWIVYGAVCAAAYAVHAPSVRSASCYLRRELYKNTKYNVSHQPERVCASVRRRWTDCIKFWFIRSLGRECANEAEPICQSRILRRDGTKQDPGDAQQRWRRGRWSRQ